MRYFILIFNLFICISSSLHAQLRVGAICEYPNEKNVENTNYSSLKIAASTTKNKLPFREDFTSLSYYNGPDTSKWLAGGNTYINNTFCKFPPSYNVVTFDGMKSNGFPYNTINIFNNGFTDFLTSKPFDLSLSNYTPADSIYLSFYWQQNGFGEQPDASDYLRVYFLDTANVWQTVYTINGSTAIANTTFQLLMLPIKDSAYFHDNFQFKLQAYGRQSGTFDVWNVDYIILDKNRFAADSIFPDWALSTFTKPVVLKDWYSMPYKHFFVDDSLYLQDLEFYSRALLTTSTSSSEWSVVFSNNLGSRVDSLGLTNLDYDIIGKSIIYTKDTFVTINQPVQLKYEIRLKVQLDSIMTNNVMNGMTEFWDYYSYDDGSPESSVGADYIGARVANQFNIPVKDTLTDIAINFVISTGGSLNGNEIFLCVWDKNFNRIHQQVINIAYGKYVNYKLTQPIVINANEDFYIGYQQNINAYLTVGMDRNNDHKDKIYYSLSNTVWGQYEDQVDAVAGSMMMRPIFSDGETLVPVYEPYTKLENCILYPNPTQGDVNIPCDWTKLELYNAQGILINTYEYNTTDPVRISAESSGTYILKIFDDHQVSVQKLMFLKD